MDTMFDCLVEEGQLFGIMNKWNSNARKTKDVKILCVKKLMGKIQPLNIPIVGYSVTRILTKFMFIKINSAVNLFG